MAYQDERVPAFCDRVLWRSVVGLGGAVSLVWSAPAVSSSDHKPVAARLYLEIRSTRTHSRASLRGASTQTFPEPSFSGAPGATLRLVKGGRARHGPGLAGPAMLFEGPRLI